MDVKIRKKGNQNQRYFMTSRIQDICQNAKSTTFNFSSLKSDSWNFTNKEINFDSVSSLLFPMKRQMVVLRPTFPNFPSEIILFLKTVEGA